MAHSSDQSGRPRTKKKRRGRASVAPVASTRSERSDDATSDADRADVNEEARTTRNTERPVAHSVKPPAPSTPASNSKRGFVWVAALLAFGVVGYAFRNPNSDGASSQAARAPNVVAQNAPALEQPPRVDEAQNPAPVARVDQNVSPVAENQPTTTASENTPTTKAAKVERTNQAVTAASTASPVLPRSAALRAAAIAAEPSTEPNAAEPALSVKPAPFSMKAANLSLETSARAASSCRRGSDPSGVARAVVTFAPTGRVTAAVISGPPFAGTETGSCIARALRQTVIPAFEGAITTVSKTVEVQ